MGSAGKCIALGQFYVLLYKKQYGHEPVDFNIMKARWSFETLLAVLTYDEIKELLEYYFTTYSARQHSLDGFLYHYQVLIENRAAAAEDIKNRAILREQTAQRAKEWRDKLEQRKQSN